MVDRLEWGKARWQDVICQFDYRQPLDGSALREKKITEVGLAEQWLVDSRPSSPCDEDPRLGDARPDETDTALIRLAEQVGSMPVGGPSADPQAPPRKWIDTGIAQSPLAAGNQVFLLQHPQGEPLQLTIGTVTRFNGAGTRVRYDANSKAGSSGSPCFDADLRLVALHHSRDPADPPAWNEGIPLATIQQTWRDNNVFLP